MDKLIIHGKPFIPGSANGTALVSKEPLSFWGGYDWKTGEIIDRRDQVLTTDFLPESFSVSTFLSRR